MFRWKGVYVRKTVLVHFEFTIESHYLTSVQGSSTILQRWGWRFRTLWVSFSEPCWKKKKKQGMQMLLTEVQVRQYWRFSWRFSTPAILFALLVFSWWQNFFLILLILVYIWPGLGLLVGFLLSSTRSEFGHISYQGQPYPTWVQVQNSILHTRGNNLESNQHVVLPCHMLEPRWWDIWSLAAQWWLCPFLESSRCLQESRLKNSSVENER